MFSVRVRNLFYGEPSFTLKSITTRSREADMYIITIQSPYVDHQNMRLAFEGYLQYAVFLPSTYACVLCEILLNYTIPWPFDLSAAMWNFINNLQSLHPSNKHITCTLSRSLDTPHDIRAIHAFPLFRYGWVKARIIPWNDHNTIVLRRNIVARVRDNVRLWCLPLYCN